REVLTLECPALYAPPPASALLARRHLEEGEQLVERGVALVEALLHARLEHAVTLLSRVEQARDNHLGPTIAEILERRGIGGEVPGPRGPLEGMPQTLGGRDFPVAPLETVNATRRVLNVAPVPPALDLHALNDELVAPPPPLGDELRIGERPPHALAGGV